MSPEDRAALRESARQVRVHEFNTSMLSVFTSWQLQTSNSFRRIGLHGDGDVLCATAQRDGHPDLLAAPGVLDYIVAAQPRAVVDLLDQVDNLEEKLERARGLADKITDVESKLKTVGANIVALSDAIVKLTSATTEIEFSAAGDQLLALLATINGTFKEIL